MTRTMPAECGRRVATRSRRARPRDERRGTVDEQECPYVDETSGEHVGICNSCGEEAPMTGWECCEGGEVEPFDDEKCEDI
jgi:hypothetical protein